MVNMKQDYKYTYILLFILSACSQPIVEPQAATAVQEVVEIIEPTLAYTSSPSLTPTVEKKEIKINSAFPLKDIAKGIEHPENYSPVALEDITSGRLLEAVKAQSEENPPFTEKAIPRNRVFFVPTEVYLPLNDVYIEVEIAAVKSIPEDSDPEVRPIGIVSLPSFYR